MPSRPALDPATRQRRRQPARARVELGVASAQGAVIDSGVVGEDRGRALEERQGGERLEIRRVAVEIDVVRRERHGVIIRLLIVSFQWASLLVKSPREWRCRGG